MNCSQFIEDLISGGEYRLGDPWRLGKDGLTILVPVRYQGQGFKRAYILPSENKEKVQVRDTGSISEVFVRNASDKGVFFRAGTIFKGNGTQSRAVVSGTIVQPQSKEQVVEVRCVHASRGISRDSAFVVMDEVAPRVVLSALYEGQGNQGRVWSAVNNYSAGMARRAGGWRASSQYAVHMDSLPVAIERGETVGFSQKVMDELSKVPDYEDQVGIAIIDMRGVRGVEAFDHPDSWKALGKEVLKSYEDIFSEAGEVAELFEINLNAAREKVKAFLRKVQAVTLDNAEGTQKIDHDDVVGELTTLFGRCIHLILTQKETKDDLGTLEGPYPSRTTISNGSIIGGSPRRRTPSQMPAQAQYSVAMTKPGKGFYMALARLKEKDRTFNELADTTSIARGTLSSRLREFYASGLAEKYEREDGKRAWRLTAKGHSVIQSV
jgi:DNA-binding HxlR family transcriptional regulator